MAEFSEVVVTLQSGVDIQVHAWAGHDEAQPLVIVAPDSSPGDWDEFVSFLNPSHAPLIADVSSALDLLMLIWEIGEPVLLLSQGELAADIACGVVAAAPGAVTSFIVCDGAVSSSRVADMHGIPTLILRGRQSSILSHETAVQMHNSLARSILIEPENCGDFSAKDNPDAAAAAVNWFIAGRDRNYGEFASSEPIDPTE